MIYMLHLYSPVLPLAILAFPSSRHHLSNDCLEGNKENYQNCSCCVVYNNCT